MCRIGQSMHDRKTYVVYILVGFPNNSAGFVYAYEVSVM